MADTLSHAFKNSVKTTEHKECVLIETSETSNSSQITFTPIDISNAFKSLKIGKACGVDGVSAEHFLYAHDILHVAIYILHYSWSFTIQFYENCIGSYN